MAIASILANVLHLAIDEGRDTRDVTMSLQRHHYRYCGSGAGLQINSLIYATVDDKTLIAEAVAVGGQIEKLIGRKGAYDALFGKIFTAKSGRTYLLDNSGLKPHAPPNHFFVTGGPQVWDKMTQDQYVVAAAIRRTEEAISSRRTGKADYTNPKVIYRIQHEPGGINNPVVQCYIAAKTAFAQVRDAEDKLKAVSGRSDIVDCVKNL